MSVADQFKNLFNKKPASAAADVSAREQDANATLAMRAGQTLQAPLDASSAEESRLLLGEDSSLQFGGGDEKVFLPGFGRAPVRQHQQVLTIALVFFLIVLGAFAAYSVFTANQATTQVSAAGNALTQSQRLAKSVSQALLGSAQAFPEVRESADVMAANMRGLKTGGEGELTAGLAAVPAELQEDVDALMPLVEKAEKNAGVVMGQQGILTQVGTALRTINRQSSDLLEVAETVSSLKLQQNAAPSELAASGQLVMLTQRIGKSANEFLTMEGVSPEAVFLLGKDLNSFKEIAEGLLGGSAELRLQATKDPQVKERLETLLKGYEETRTQAGAILGNLQGLVAAREAQSSIIADSEPLRRGIEELEEKLTSRASLSLASILGMVIPGLLALLCAAGLVYVQRQEFMRRQVVADRQRQDAERMEQEAKRVNDGNQAAILRLMNELQTVAEGDLTQEATVTEDITGAIADSVNYTVEELRSLVGSVQNTAARVAQTTAAVEGTSTELLAASTEQLREIRETGQSVLDMAQRINKVSDQAQQSAQVARQSLQAAEQGLTAVQNAIGGMNSIRDQIQDTSKRIKRLGESSQEIGEITELISDITE
jgi:twitching motility protein PilJ